MSILSKTNEASKKGLQKVQTQQNQSGPTGRSLSSCAYTYYQLQGRPWYIGMCFVVAPFFWCESTWLWLLPNAESTNHAFTGVAVVVYPMYVSTFFLSICDKVKPFFCNELSLCDEDIWVLILANMNLYFSFKVGA